MSSLKCFTTEIKVILLLLKFYNTAIFLFISVKLLWDNLHYINKCDLTLRRMNVTHLFLIGQSPDTSGHLCSKNDEQEHKELERARKSEVKWTTASAITKTFVFNSVSTSVIQMFCAVEDYGRTHQSQHASWFSDSATAAEEPDHHHDGTCHNEDVDPYG